MITVSTKRATLTISLVACMVVLREHRRAATGPFDCWPWTPSSSHLQRHRHFRQNRYCTHLVHVRAFLCVGAGQSVKSRRTHTLPIITHNIKLQQMSITYVFCTLCRRSVFLRLLRRLRQSAGARTSSFGVGSF